MRYLLLVTTLFITTTATAGIVWGPCRCHPHAIPDISEEISSK